MRQSRRDGGVPDRAPRVPRRYIVRSQEVATRRPPSGNGSRGGDDDASDEVEDAASAVAAWRPAPRRCAERPAVLIEDYVQEALVACIQRTCGRPTSHPLVARSSTVTARVVGLKNSRSRAVVLRTGVGKKEIAIMWVSCRDGLLCSCFAGTQNPLFLSASSWSTKCSHTTAVGKALAASGVDIQTFRGRMRLRDDAGDFAMPEVYGSAVVWAVLYRSVFSNVFFSFSYAPACIAPCCRRFRGRCGHVRVARDRQGPDGFLDVSTGTALAAVKARLHARKHAGAERAKVINNEEEDEGVEKEESDTIRGPNNADQAKVSRRVPRSLIPCSSEADQGAVWMGTAGWRALYVKQRAAALETGNHANLKRLNELSLMAMAGGHVRDVRDVLEESFCGS